MNKAIPAEKTPIKPTAIEVKQEIKKEKPEFKIIEQVTIIPPDPEVIFKYESVDAIIKQLEEKKEEDLLVPMPAPQTDAEETYVCGLSLLAACANTPYIGRLISKDNVLLVTRHIVEIGRNSSRCKVDFHVAEDTFISRKHLILHYDENHDFHLICASKNGIFINDVFHRHIDKHFKLPDSCTFRFPSTNHRIHFENLMAHKKVTVPEVEQEIIVTEEKTPEKPKIYRMPSPAHSHQDFRVSSSGITDDSPQDQLEKPPYSYAQLIVQAISAAPQKRLTLAGIYSYITQKYPYYHAGAKGWQNSIRHNLSLNQHFQKIPRSQEDPGKGSFWTLDPSSEEKMVTHSMKKRGRLSTGHHNVSGGSNVADNSLNSLPTSPNDSSNALDDYMFTTDPGISSTYPTLTRNAVQNHYESYIIQQGKGYHGLDISDLSDDDYVELPKKPRLAYY